MSAAGDTGGLERARELPERGFRAGLRVVRLEGFEEPCRLPEGELEAYRRRFATLFADDATARRGGLGRVVRVVNALGETYALKTLVAPERADGEDEEAHAARRERSRAAFREEYEVQRALSGFKGFPRLYGYGTVAGEPAIVMEWVEGMTLDQAREILAVDARGRLSPLTAARIGRDLFDVLMRLELVGEGFVHRDISPANVMVRTARLPLERQAAEGAFDLCLIDFGSTAPAGAARGTSLTDAGATVRRATPAYAPPEMLTEDARHLRQLRSSPSIDVYAAAGVVYRLLDGGLPFELAGSAADDAAAGDAPSPYRIKTDTAARRPSSAHDADADIASVLVGEPEVAFAAGSASLDLSLDPGSRELQRALELVDGQLADLLLACLSPRQAARPTAEAMHDGLEAFCANYTANVERALHGESLIPCTDRASWLASASPFAVRRVVYTAGKAASLAVLLVVALATAVVLDGVRASWQLGPVGWDGRLPAAAVALALLAPACAGAAAGRRMRGTRGGFVRGTAALAGVGALLAATVGCMELEVPQGAPALYAAAFAAVAAGWCPIVLDYAMTVVSAALAEAGRALPEGPASPSGARLAAAPASGRALEEGRPVVDAAAVAGTTERGGTCR